MRSFRINKVSARRATFLNLMSQVGSQLRDAYALRNEEGAESQSSLAKKLGVDRSAINRRLSGKTNMTLQSLADLVWALGYAIKVVIVDPRVHDGTNWAPTVADSDTGLKTVPSSLVPTQSKTYNPTTPIYSDVH